LNGGPTEILYERYQKSIIKYLREVVVENLKTKQGDGLLLEAVKRWRDHRIIVRWMQKVFDYLDRYYTKHNNRDSLKDVGLKCFQESCYQTVKDDMKTALLQRILQERNGDQIDRSVMKDGVSLFIEMGLNSLTAYEQDFEGPLISATSTFYKHESGLWISQDSCPSYMKKAEDRLNEEHARCKNYLHSSTEPNLIKKVEAELITAHAKRLLEMEGSGLLKLLEDHKTEDLSRMYRLFKRVNELAPMSEMMRTFITEEGHNIIKNFESKDELDVTGYIDSLLALHEKYSNLINFQMDKDPLFLESMKDAFTNFVNTDITNPERKNKSSTAELLSTYADNLMKNTDKAGEDLETFMDKIVRLFGYISDKDMFNEYYRRQLSKRLLVSKTNKDAERSLISKLKMRCGASFTSKLEGMIKDQNLSSDLNDAFKDYVGNKNIKLEMEFIPQVLTTGFWPAFKIDQLTVTSEFDSCLKTFKTFYDDRTQSRSLKWVHSLGTCQVIGRNYSDGNKELMTSTYQACILVLFNQSSKLSAGDIQKTLNLPFDDIRKNLLSLSVSKQCQILNKDGNPKSVIPTDVFEVNAEFTSKQRRIKIPNLVMKITEKESEEIDSSLKEDRKHAIEATVVRIMKARKQMTHQNLVVETSKQLMLHFKPDPKDIKRRIEDLIVREYLERDESQSNSYKYLA
jgi:cullin 1